MVGVVTSYIGGVARKSKKLSFWTLASCHTRLGIGCVLAHAY